MKFNALLSNVIVFIASYKINLHVMSNAAEHVHIRMAK